MPYKDRETKRAKGREYYAANAERVKAKTQEWRAQNPEYAAEYYEAHRDYYRRAQYQRSYGLSLEDLDRMKQEQGGNCKVCQKPFDNIRMVVDHDHATNQVRGLLCQNCNTRLGWYEKFRKVIECYVTG